MGRGGGARGARPAEREGAAVASEGFVVEKATPPSLVVPPFSMEHKRRRVRGQHEIDVEDIAADPRPGMAAPSSIAFSADDRHVGYLIAQSGSREQVLLCNEIGDDGRLSPAQPFVRQALAPSGGEESLTLEERMRRERTRSWGHGVTSFAWGASSTCVLLQAGGAVFVQRGADGELQLLVGGGGEGEGGTREPVLDPKLSPDERFLAFVRSSELCVLELPRPAAGATAAEPVVPGDAGRAPPAAGRRTRKSAGTPAAFAPPVPGAATSSSEAPPNTAAQPTQLTHGASATISHGLADFCAQEEMHRFEGYWWSPDSHWIAFQETDEGSIREFTIVHHSEASALARETHRYPFAGGSNASVRIGVVRAQPGRAHAAAEPLWLDLGIADSAWTTGTWASGEARESDEADQPAQQGTEARSAPAGGAERGTHALGAGARAPPDDVGGAGGSARAAAGFGRYGSSGHERFADGYVADVRWAGEGGAGGHDDSSALFAIVQDRRQHILRLLRFAPPGARGEWRAEPGARGAHAVLLGTVLIHEVSDAWTNLNTCLRQLPGGALAWASERTGFLHLFAYSQQGECIAPLTRGEWVVDALLGATAGAGGGAGGSAGGGAGDGAGGGGEAAECARIFFTASLGDARQKNLFSAPVLARAARGGGDAPVPPAPTRLTHDDGWHEVVLSRSCKVFVDVFCSVDQPYRVTLHSLSDGSKLGTLYQNADPRLSTLTLPAPRLITLRNRHGVALHGALYEPRASFARPRPLIVSCYGGPDIQIASNMWGLTGAMREQYFAQEGYVVLRLDGRGSARRGKAFELPLYRNMGEAEVEDQADGVRHLIAQGLVDASRVGVIGWSYGGYLALLCLARAPDVFHAAVAGAPVTHWEGYDTHYTERYMGLPRENPAGYTRSSVLTHTDSIADSARLLLVHGLLDENVHFRHTARLIDELIKSRKRYELLIFPNERHTPRRHSDRVFLEERIFDFFQSALAAVAR